ncbi:uncharacterized protein LOC115877722 [Sitophilus oryzae]|uniref:Uncharacterized protein LOC115877722 n=1 Tax=Sitophilus oryzae TaxID=7048 RepID=A0A6J2XF30_SITOR|nr:uncharacterized protein LOC115877722 [Sitophilus oryzae]
MNSMIVALLVVCAAASTQALWGRSAALVGPGTPGALIQGPAAEGELWGPDGSRIAAAGQAGAIAAPPLPGGVVRASVVPGVIGLGLGGGLGGGLGVGIVGARVW